MRKYITLSLAVASTLFAAVPTISDVVKETAPSNDLVQKTQPLIDITGAEEYPPAMKDDKKGKTILVNTFTITGARHMDTNELQSLIASYTGKPLTFTQIQEAASILTKAYRAKGYFVARAYIPKQIIQEGSVEIAIVEGNYGEFKLHNISLVNDSIVQGILDTIKSTDIISTASLERALLIINDTPGVKVSQADVMPGALIGTSDFAIRTQTTNRYDGYLLGDNYGSRYTGSNRLITGINLNSPTGIGDKLSITGLISNESGLKYGKIAYAVPLMSNGLTGELSYSAADYRLSDRYTSLDAYGKALFLEAALSYPIIRTRAQTLKLTTGIASKSLTDYQLGTLAADKDITAWNIGLTHTKRQTVLGFNTQTDTGAILTAGNLKFTDDTSRISDAVGVNTQGRYNKINGYAGITMVFSRETSLETTLKFQKAMGNKNLDGSEDFSLGGNTGVKVCPYAELSAENGIMLNTELFQALPSFNRMTHKAGIFHDIGKATMADSSKTANFQSRTFQDIGLGYYALFEGFFANAQFAHLLGGERITSEPSYKNKFMIQLGLTF